MEAFQRAEEKRRSKTRFLTDEQLLETLREYVQKEGRIRGRLMGRRYRMPSVAAYIRRFGSLWRAYELAGIPPSEHCTAQARSLRCRIAEKFQQAMIVSGAPFERMGRVYAVRGCTPFVFDVAKSLEPLVSGEMRWELYLRKEMPSGPCAAARLTPDNHSIQDWCMFEISSRGQQRFPLRDSVVRAGDSVRGTPNELIQLILDRLHRS